MVLSEARFVTPLQRLGNKKVLVVDDEESIRALLITLLQDEGYDVFAAKDGVDAMQQLGVIQVDLVITDMVMPNANGLDVLKESRRLDPDRPVIIVTGYPSVATAVKLVSLGASDYITKPFNIDLIKITVAKVLARREFDAETTSRSMPIGRAPSYEIAEPYNFMLFNQMLEREIARSRLRKRRCSLLVAELQTPQASESPESVEDWEDCVENLFRMAQRYTRPGDIVGRTDPDQLSVILPETSGKEAQTILQRILAGEPSDDWFILGVVTYPDDGDDLYRLNRAARAALKTARAEGT